MRENVGPCGENCKACMILHYWEASLPQFQRCWWKTQTGVIDKGFINHSVTSSMSTYSYRFHFLSTPATFPRGEMERDSLGRHMQWDCLPAEDS